MPSARRKQLASALVVEIRGPISTIQRSRPPGVCRSQKKPSYPWKRQVRHRSRLMGPACPCPPENAPI
eukprot:8367018-Alexandrium_andersonii.AAC.1